MTTVNWSQLAADFGTPLVVLSRSLFRERIQEVQTQWENAVTASRGGLMKPPRFYFPLKANDCTSFLQDLAPLGFGADVSDERELYLATRDLGMLGKDLVVNGPAKDSALLAQAVSLGACIHIESLSEAYDLLRISTATSCIARVGIRLRLFETSKFGLCPNDRELVILLDLLRDKPVFFPISVQQHDPSVLNSSARLREATLRLVDFAGQFHPSTDSPIQIDLGGGLDFDTGEFRSVQEFIDCFIQITDEIAAGNSFLYAFEWGRSIVRDCGSVVARVIRIKQSADQWWVLIDVGQNVFGGDHAKVTCSTVECVNVHKGLPRKVHVAGPLCFSSDMLMLGTKLPKDLKQGDLLVLRGAGAYTITTRWSGPGANPVLLIEDSGRTHSLGRLRGGEFSRVTPHRPIDGLFLLFFDEAVAAGAARQDLDMVASISSGINQLSAPECLVRLHAEEATTFGGLSKYTGPHGPEEVLVAALAYERALASDYPINRTSCSVVAGAAQGVRRALGYLSQRGFDRCLVVGPQYPWVYDVIEAAALGVEEIIGEFEDGFIPEAESIGRHLRYRPRSIVFLTVPNNPSGSCPDDDWLKTVCQFVIASDGHLIVDRSSEDLPFCEWVVFSRCSEQLLNHLGPEHCTIVASPSKSRSCPGLRIGYVIGSPDFVRHIAHHQYTEYLSLSRYGVSFVVADLILRTLWWRVHKCGESPNVAMGHVLRTTSDPHSLGIDAVHIPPIAELLEPYSEQCRERLDKIRAALKAFRLGVGRQWLGSTKLQNGFNVIAELAWKGDPHLLARELYLSTGLRILPSYCFTLNGKPLPGRYGGTTIRLSCATEAEALRRSAVRFAEYLNRGCS